MSVLERAEVEEMIEYVCAATCAGWHPRRVSRLKNMLRGVIQRACELQVDAPRAPDCREAVADAYAMAAALAAMAEPKLALKAERIATAETMQHIIVEMLRAMEASARRSEAA